MLDEAGGKAVGTAAHIQHAPQAGRIGLLREDSDHTACSQAIQVLQAGEFCFVGAILHKIRTGVLSPRVTGTLLNRFAYVSSLRIMMAGHKGDEEQF